MLEPYPAEALALIEADEAADERPLAPAGTRQPQAPALYAVPPEAPLAMADQSL